MQDILTIVRFNKPVVTYGYLLYLNHLQQSIWVTRYQMKNFFLCNQLKYMKSKAGKTAHERHYIFNNKIILKHD